MISVTEQKIEWPTDAEFLWSVSCSGIKMNLELTLGLQFWQGGGAQCWEFSLSLDVRREVRVLSTLQGYRSTA